MKGLTAMTEAVGMVVQMAEGSRGRNDGAQRQEPWQGGWGGDGGRGEGDGDANDANNGDGGGGNEGGSRGSGRENGSGDVAMAAIGGDGGDDVAMAAGRWLERMWRQW